MFDGLKLRMNSPYSLRDCLGFPDVESFNLQKQESVAPEWSAHDCVPSIRRSDSTKPNNSAQSCHTNA